MANGRIKMGITLPTWLWTKLDEFIEIRKDVEQVTQSEIIEALIVDYFDEFREAWDEDHDVREHSSRYGGPYVESTVTYEEV